MKKYFFSDGVLWAKGDSGIAELLSDISNNILLIQQGQLVIDYSNGSSYIYDGAEFVEIGGN